MIDFSLFFFLRHQCLVKKPCSFFCHEWDCMIVFATTVTDWFRYFSYIELSLLLYIYEHSLFYPHLCKAVLLLLASDVSVQHSAFTARFWLALQSHCSASTTLWIAHTCTAAFVLLLVLSDKQQGYGVLQRQGNSRLQASPKLQRKPMISICFGWRQRSLWPRWQQHR